VGAEANFEVHTEEPEAELGKALRVVLASVSARGGKSKLGATDSLVEEYLGRLSQGWMIAESRVFATEAALLQAAGRGDGGATKAKSKAVVVWLDGRGKRMSSEQFAAWLGGRRDGGVQELWIAVGPADGWTHAMNAIAEDLQLSLGPMTLAHELARVVAAEQLYRAWAILQGHPYHRGH